MKRRGSGPDLDGAVVEGAKNFVFAVIAAACMAQVWYHFDYRATADVVMQWFNLPVGSIFLIANAPTAFEGMTFHMDEGYKKVSSFKKIKLVGYGMVVFDVITDTIWMHSKVGNIYAISDRIGTGSVGWVSELMTGGAEWLISLFLGILVAIGPELVIGGLLLAIIIHFSDFLALLGMIIESVRDGFEQLMERTKANA